MLSRSRNSCLLCQPDGGKRLCAPGYRLVAPLNTWHSKVPQTSPPSCFCLVLSFAIKSSHRLCRLAPNPAAPPEAQLGVLLSGENPISSPLSPFLVSGAPSRGPHGHVHMPDMHGLSVCLPDPGWDHSQACTSPLLPQSPQLEQTAALSAQAPVLSKPLGFKQYPENLKIISLFSG